MQTKADTSTHPGDTGAPDGLPPLPEGRHIDSGLERRSPGYTTAQVREYAMQAAKQAYLSGVDAGIAAERERCAKLCESLHSLPCIEQTYQQLARGSSSYSGKDVDSYDETAQRIAAAIRSQ